MNVSSFLSPVRQRVLIPWHRTVVPLVILAAGAAGATVASSREPLVATVALLAVTGVGFATFGRWGALVLGLFLVSLPLFESYLSFNPEGQLSPLKDALLAIAIIASLLDRRAVTRLLAGWSVVDSMVLVFPVLYLAALPTAPSLVQGIFGFKVTFWYASLYVLARLHAPAFVRRDRIVWLSVALFAGFVIWEFLSSHQLFALLPIESNSGRLLWTPETRVRFSPGVMPVSIGGIFALWLALFSGSIRWRVVGSALLLGSLYILIFASLRTAFVSVVAGAVVVVFGYVKSAQSRIAVATLAAALVLVGSVVALQVGLFDDGAPLQLRTLGTRVDELNAQLLPALGDWPLGQGAGTVSGTQGTIGFKDLTSGDADRVFFHSSYLSFALEMGWLPGALLFASMLLVVLACLRRPARPRNLPASLPLLSAAIMTAFVVAGIANPALYQFPLNAIAWFWAGIGLSSAVQHERAADTS